MARSFYLSNPNLRDYYLSLPREVQLAIDRYELEISTPGELQMWASNFDSLYNSNPFSV